jgi:hypothetical protein
MEGVLAQPQHLQQGGTVEGQEVGSAEVEEGVSCHHLRHVWRPP